MSFKIVMSAALVVLTSLWCSASGATVKATPSQGLVEAGYVLPPVSFTKFCIDYPEDCPAAGGQSRVHMTQSRWADLRAVNRRVNQTIAPTPDTTATRYWTLNVSRGDCNAFAVQKRHDLLAANWPAGSLALTVVRTSWGEGHLVLTVRTDHGDLVLDNLREEIFDWKKAGYAGVMRQSDRNPQFWVALNADRPALLRRAERSEGAPRGKDRAREGAPAPRQGPTPYSIQTASVGETGSPIATGFTEIARKPVGAVTRTRA